MRQIKAVLCVSGLLLNISCALAQPPDVPPAVVRRLGETPLAAPVALQIPAELHPERTPQDTIYDFVFWLNGMNLRECVALVDDATFSPMVAKAQQDMDKEGRRFSLMVDEPRVEMTGEDTARANVETTVLTLEDRRIDRQTTIDWLELRRVAGVWKLASEAGKVPDENVSILSDFVRFLATPENSRGEARSKACTSNMRQLCLGMFQLAQDFDGKFGIKRMQELQQANNKDFAKWPILVQAVLPYVKSLQIFRCPEDRNKGEGATSYSFNENLEGVAQDNIAEPSKVVLLCEGKDGKLEFRHDGRATVGFADGHVKLINEEEVKTLLWRP